MKVARHTIATDRRRNARSGFTLPEAMLALVILGMAAAGVLLPFASGATVQAESMHRTLAAKLANDLMEQIIGTAHGSIIATWNGYTEAQGQVADASGTVFSDPLYAGFSRTASCQAKYVASGPPLTTNFILIKVIVAWQGREIMTLSSLINI
ncbi:MAG: prepilin-type N-terminal cleavage/methylation domain-containing protein [Phycisphaerales bacterium]